MRHRGDRSKRLAPETERADAVEILKIAYLACCMMPERGNGVLRAHTGTVVDDLDKILPRAFYDNVNIRRACVNGIFHKLLHDGFGTLDDLAGAYLACQMLRKNGNARRHHALHPRNTGCIMQLNIISFFIYSNLFLSLPRAYTFIVRERPGGFLRSGISLVKINLWHTDIVRHECRVRCERIAHNTRALVILAHRRDADDTLDGCKHARCGIHRMIDRMALCIRGYDKRDRAMRVDVIARIRRVILNDEYRALLPERRMRDGRDDLAESEIVIRRHCARRAVSGGNAGGMIVRKMYYDHVRENMMRLKLVKLVLPLFPPDRIHHREIETWIIFHHHAEKIICDALCRCGKRIMRSFRELAV